MNELNFELIKCKRKALKITLKDMANALGFKNASTYFKYESGTYKFKAEHIPLLTSLLQIKQEEIFLIA